jgi:magnesium-transporting ATPase (P-type)
LTGDKVETAINIGKSTQVLTPELTLLKIEGMNKSIPGPKNPFW